MKNETREQLRDRIWREAGQRYEIVVRIEGEDELRFRVERANHAQILREAIEAKHGTKCNVLIFDIEQDNRRIY